MAEEIAFPVIFLNFISSAKVCRI